MEGSVREDTGDKLGLGELRKWEDLNKDCLINIFERAEMETVILSVPHVCKNWHLTTLDPQCWKVLDFESIMNTFHALGYEYSVKSPVRGLVKFAVGRSQGLTTKVVLGYFCLDFEEIMTCISDGCPMLETLILREVDPLLSKLIKDWSHLRHLSIERDVRNVDLFHDILNEISTHCKNFTSLTITRLGVLYGHANLTTITTLLPNVKMLTLSGLVLSREDLILIFSECRALEFLDVTDCVVFDGDDAEILKMASHIGTFRSKGCRVDDFDNCEFDAELIEMVSQFCDDLGEVDNCEFDAELIEMVSQFCDDLGEV